VAPALATLRGAEPQRRALEAQLQQMQGLQAQAKALQAQPRLAPDEARRLLEASVKPLAPTLQLALVGDRATVTLKGMTADALAQWLAQVRLNVRVLPTEARLRRSAAGTWDGTLVLNLGAP
jgi:general secretion pathway protein M